MASISSLSSGSSAISNKGIGGLATGLNTDELVDALISGTKNKIAKQGQQKQLLNWKMTAYRSIATALTAFQAKSLKAGASGTNTNIMHANFFNTYKATSSSSKVSVATTSNSTTGNFTINKVTQLAEAESYTSVKKLSATLSTNFTEGKEYKPDAFTGQTLKLEATGFAAVSVKLDDLNGAIKADGTLDLDAFKDQLQGLIDKAYYGSKVVDVSVKDGQIVLDSKSAKITVAAGNSLLGLSAGATNRVTTDSTIGSLDAFKGIQGDTMTFMINGTEISVNKNDKISTLMSKINNSDANVRMEYDSHSDKFKLTSKLTGTDSKIEMQDLHGNLLNEIFGAQGGNGIGTGYLTTGNSITSLNANTIDSMTDAQRKALLSDLDGMSFDMTVDGVTKTVKLDIMLGITADKRASGKYTAEDVYKSINAGIQNAFWNSGIEFSGDKDGHTVITTPNNNAISTTISGQLASLLGTGGKTMTNIVNDYGYERTVKANEGFVTMEELGLSQDNPKASFDMTINGVTKTINVSLDTRPPADGEDIGGTYYNEDLTADAFVSKLNAAIKSAFGSDAATFSATYEYSKETAADLKGITDTVTFDEDSGSYKINGNSIANHIAGQAKTQDELREELKIGELPEGVYVLEYEAGEDEDGNAIKKQTLVDAEGYLVDLKGNRINKDAISFNLTLNTNDSAKGVATKSVSMSGAFVETLGFNVDETNTVRNSADGAGIKLSEIAGGQGLTSGTLTLGNGETVSYSKDDTLQDFLNKLNTALGDSGSAGLRDGKLYIESSGKELSIEDSNAANGMLKKIFGIDGGKYETAAASYSEVVYNEDGTVKSGTYAAGKNAEYEINGVKMWWSSNTVSYNNVNLTLHEVSNEEIKINVQSDPDDVVKRIEEWMTDYNALVHTLNSMLNEGKNKEYTPLTDEQKAEMTQDQIKTWETEAKKGILRNDQTLRGILSDMRKSLYEKVESAGISLFDIGIVTKSGLSDPNEAGQLEFDKNIAGGGEERLRKMLTDNPDKVRMLFTDPDNGIGVKLNNVITRATETSSIAEKRGSLVRIAGTDKMTGDNTSQIGNKVSALDKYIATLKARMESEYNRYWKKFSSLETAVQKMNSQSSWLAGQ